MKDMSVGGSLTMILTTWGRRRMMTVVMVEPMMAHASQTTSAIT